MMAQEKKILHIHPHDNVVVVIKDLNVGEQVILKQHEFRTRAAIVQGHKIALLPIHKGDMVIKYGFPIGKAISDIEPGEWVHTHNLFTNLEGIVDYTYTPVTYSLPTMEAELTFDGFIRANGEVGIRNELWIIPTVGCINKTAERLAHKFRAELPENSGVDGVHVFPHSYGCSQLGDDERRTQQTLAGLVRHPNAAGVLVVSLGCEHNHVKAFQRVLGEFDPQRVRFLIAQECDDEIEAGMGELRQLAAYAAQFRRQPVPVSKLKVGMKCGASDGFSGISANPLVGAFSDLLVASGGTSVLTEVPEMFGAETLLLNRCRNREVFEKCVKMINGFKTYYLSHQQPIYENPAPGNKTGGISTLEEKSLGCIQKGGFSPVVDVLDYGEHLQIPGLNLLTGPGDDAVSITLLTAAGAQLILFTTGRGNPLGAPAPTVKISSNTRLAAQKPHWIDFNAGELLEGVDLNRLARKLFHDVLAVASGKALTWNERNNYREIALFKDGVML
ncbi:altronate hydrolase [Candidatus Vecturithrix granuli]|uniref:Altronate hydrolase n=1 Tax=Vecturithrix granuli TaxID=1499967 RepID=A0A081C6S9_VECG1|nr:altronate hydrolase [Candidatus Vecturithrix granuli]